MDNMQAWSWSWINILSLVGIVFNCVLPFWLSHLEKQISLNTNASTQIPFAQEAVNYTMPVLRSFAQSSRRLVLLGIPLQIVSFLLAGLAKQYSIRVGMSLLFEVVALCFIWFAYIRWNRMFSDQSIANTFQLIHKKMQEVVNTKVVK